MEISPETCISGRDLTEPRLSPDGATVTFVVRGAGPAALVAVPVDGGPERQVSTWPPPSAGRGMGGGCHAWTPDGDGVVLAAVDGDLWFQPVRDAAGPRRLTRVGAGAAAQAPVVADTPDGRAVAYVVQQAEVWIAWLDLDRPPLRIDEGRDDFCLDPWIHTDVGSDRWTVRWQAWTVPDMPWDGSLVRLATVATVVAVAAGATVVDRSTVSGRGAIVQPRTLPDGRPIGVRDDRGWLNLWVDDVAVVDEPFEHAGPTWGPGLRSYAVSPDGGRVAFTRNERGFGRLCVVDLADGRVSDVARGVHGQLDWRGDRLVALRSGARTPTQVAVYDTASWDRTVLAVGPVSGWDTVDLPEPEPVDVVDHDVTLHARRYASGSGRLLCWVHGGPTDQWQVEFLPRVAYWWAQGWDVLVVDPRGTTGHGRAYQQALRGGWGRLDVDDTAALVRHAHAAGWSTPETTVAVGGSSGGLTVLGLSAFHPDLLAAGIAVYPVSDLADLAERSHRFEAHYTLTLVGPLDRSDLYRERSPLCYADRISVPLLVLHGELDQVVPVDQSVELADRVAAAGGDIELHVVAGEGHGFREPANKLHEYRTMAAFLDRVVGDQVVGRAGADPSTR